MDVICKLTQNWRAMARWWVVGLVFTGWGLGALYLLKERLMLSLFAATLITAETGTLLRFLVNDRWVFGYERPTFGRLWQFHVANAASFVIAAGVVNLLPLLGIHYLLASVMATACSVGVSMVMNFVWIWKRSAEERPIAK
jgi:putative flippase GtrA